MVLKGGECGRCSKGGANGLKRGRRGIVRV